MRLADLFYAKCPQCYRLDLTIWSEDKYRPPLSVTLKLRCGAKAVRCAGCRRNFASFRPIKERFRSRRRESLPVEDQTETEPSN